MRGSVSLDKLPPMPRLRKRRSRLTSINPDLVRHVREMLRGEENAHPELWARWGEIAGAAIASRALPRDLRRRVLTVAVANSSWLHELSFLKGMLLGRIAEEIGPTKVRDIRFVLDPTAFPPRKDAVPRPISKRSAPLPDEITAALAGVEDLGIAEALAAAIRATLRDDSKP